MRKYEYTPKWFILKADSFSDLCKQKAKVALNCTRTGVLLCSYNDESQSRLRLTADEADALADCLKEFANALRKEMPKNN